MPAFYLAGGAPPPRTPPGGPRAPPGVKKREKSKKSNFLKKTSKNQNFDKIWVPGALVVANLFPSKDAGVAPPPGPPVWGPRGGPMGPPGVKKREKSKNVKFPLKKHPKNRKSKFQK